MLIDKIFSKLRRIKSGQDFHKVTYKKTRQIHLLACLLLLCGCTRTCVGVPELGSKKRPLRIGLTTNLRTAEFDVSTQNLGNCIEKNIGYKTVFIKNPDTPTALDKLRNESLDFAAVAPLPYLNSPAGLKILMMSTKDPQQPLRSVLLGPTEKWAHLVTPSTVISNRNNIDPMVRKQKNLRVIYTSTKSEWGFLVPRQMLLDEQIYPTEAIFAGNEDLVLQAISEDIASIGAVSSEFLQQKFAGQFRARIGTAVGKTLVLGMSGPLPTELIVFRETLTSKIQGRMETALTKCSQQFSESIEQLFYGSQFVKPKPRILLALQDIIDFQKLHPQVFARSDTDVMKYENEPQ